MSGRITIASIVEGYGEVTALPVLLRRIMQECGIWDARIPEPHRIPRGKLIAAGGVENAVLQASRQVTGLGGILVLFDADDDCPADYGPALLKRAQAVRSDKAMSVVLANREFEGWFLAAAASLAGHRGLADPLPPPSNPEEIRDAKGWLTHHKIDGSPYKETIDQAPLAAVFDMAQARKHAASFDKFWRDVERLIR